MGSSSTRRVLRATAVGMIAIACVLATASAAFAAPPVTRVTGPVSGAVSDQLNDGTCPYDAYFPNVLDPHQRYDGTIQTSRGPVHLTVDVCISSDGGALGGNTFRGTFTETSADGSVHGTAIGSEGHEAREVFHMDFQNGNRVKGNATEQASPRVVFSGCFYDGGPLIDASITTPDAAPNLSCGIPS